MRRPKVVAIAALATLAIGSSAALGAKSAKPVKVASGSYSGTTSEHKPITFKISGRAIKQLKTTVVYNDKCGAQASGPPSVAVSAGQVKIKANGTFSAAVEFTPSSPAFGGPQNGRLTGKAKGRSVTGTLVGPASPVVHCNGYTATFTARKK